MKNTITISRVLFEEMVDYVVELRGEWRWKQNEPRARYQQDFEELDLCANRVVSIRDRGIDSLEDDDSRNNGET